MIEKKELKTMAVLFIIIAVLAALMAWQLYTVKADERVYRISVILDSPYDDYWAIFKKGVDKAALDMNVDVHFLSPSADGSASEQQIGLIKREMETTIDAVVICASDEIKISSWLDESGITCPIVSFGTKLSTEKETVHISFDDFDMGRKLGHAVKQSSCNAFVVYKEFNTDGNINERYLGFEDFMRENDLPFAQCTDMAQVFANLEACSPTSRVALIGFDAFGTELLLNEAVPEATEEAIKANVKIFGIGSTNHLLSKMEDDVVDTLVVQSYYDIGYIAIQNAIEALIGYRVENYELDSYVVTKETMFEEPNAHILVPIS